LNPKIQNRQTTNVCHHSLFHCHIAISDVAPELHVKKMSGEGGGVAFSPPLSVPASWLLFVSHGGWWLVFSFVCLQSLPSFVGGHFRFWAVMIAGRLCTVIGSIIGCGVMSH